MSDQTREISRRWVEEVWNDGDFSSAHEYVADDIHFRSCQIPETHSLDELKEIVAGLRANFPDGHYTIDEEIVEGGSAAHRWTFRGTHEGEFLGVPGTGKHVEVTGTAVTHVRDGKVVAHLADVDMLSILQQVGAA
ncbi:MAG TPA: ester cyclase [Longimicrobiales bacterium]|nr:ester cyclase [Longimicrobiales bacterium]